MGTTEGIYLIKQYIAVKVKYHYLCFAIIVMCYCTLKHNAAVTTYLP